MTTKPTKPHDYLDKDNIYDNDITSDNVPHYNNSKISPLSGSVISPLNSIQAIDVPQSVPVQLHDEPPVPGQTNVAGVTPPPHDRGGQGHQGGQLVWSSLQSFIQSYLQSCPTCQPFQSHHASTSCPGYQHTAL